MNVFSFNRTFTFFIIGALVAVTSLSFSHPAFAQESNSNEAGMKISPAVIEPSDVLNPASSHQYSITVRNLNHYSQEFYLSTSDIVDVKDGSTPVFSTGKEEKTGMELSSWIKLPTDKITIDADAEKQIDFTIDVPDGASPGSHFGSVIISVDAPNVQRNGAAVGYKVANIIAIRVAGDANLDAGIREFSTDNYFNNSKNVGFKVRIENVGNILIRPIGPVEIRNMLGQKVDTFVFNQEQQGGVFPGRTREFTFNWNGQGTGFGRYEALISPVYGGDGSVKTMSATVTFWILPMKIIGPALAVLAVLLLIVFVFVRVYINRTLARYSHGQTRVVSGRRKSKGMSSSLLLAVVMLTVTAVFAIILLALFA